MDPRTFHLLEFYKILHILSTHAVSETGKQAALNLLPHANPATLQAENELLRQILAWKRDLDFALTPFVDLEGVCAFLAQQRDIDLDACQAIRDMLFSAQAAHEALAGVGPDLPELAAFAGQYVFPESLASALHRCLAANGTLRDESSPELFSVRMEIRRIHALCTRKVHDFFQGRDTSFLQNDFLTISSDRYVLAMKVNYKRKFPGIVHDYSQTGETCYFEPLFLVELNNQLQELKQEEAREEQKILALISTLARNQMPAIRLLSAWLTRLDLLLAKTALGTRCQGNLLDIKEDGRLELRQARHPLLALSGNRVVAIDIALEGRQRALVVSGGNSGGKTVCLKTWGLIALMALSGLPVPVAAGSVMPWYEGIFVFMGDEQDLESSLSTFSAQIRSFSEAWPRIGNKALVILDEFGTGTDPEQGAALAQAVLAALLGRCAWVGMATHFPALKLFALAHDCARAATVLFDSATKKPLYLLAYDQVGASQALLVAKEYGMPQEVLDLAHHYLRVDEVRQLDIFERLNALSVEREKEIVRLQTAQKELQEKATRQQVALKKEKEKLAGEVRQQARLIFEQWKAEKIGRKAALKKITQLRAELEKLPVDEPRAEHGWNTFVCGQNVFYPAWEKMAVITEKDERKKRLRLDFGGISVWADGRDVTLPENKERAASPSVQLRKEKAGSFRLDIRGRRVDEAAALLEKFLDNALLAGFVELEIIHGKGSGALKSAVHELLADSPVVDSCSFAQADQGGEGVTLVCLR